MSEKQGVKQNSIPEGGGILLSPCLRGTKIANPREQSQARLSYAEQEQFGQSQPKAEGVNKYPQANYAIENRH